MATEPNAPGKNPKPPSPAAAPAPLPKRRSLTRSFEDESGKPPAAPAPDDMATMTHGPRVPAADAGATLTKFGAPPPGAPSAPIAAEGATLTKAPVPAPARASGLRRSFGSDEQTMTKGGAPPAAPASDLTLTKGGVAGREHAATVAEVSDLTLTKGAVPPASRRQAHLAGGTPAVRRLTIAGRQSELLEKAEWSVGDVIAGKFEVLAIAGRGGMGVVYRVRHLEWNIEMAVKTPLPALVEDAVSRERFIREAQTWVDLGLHPNLVQCWYVRELGRLPRLFVDFMAGGSLKDWLDDGRLKPGDWPAIIDMVVQACDGLSYAHEHGVVHRDIKPANMLMTLDGRLCVTDFGLVKVANLDDIVGGTQTAAPAMDAATGLTMTGSSMGTPQYGAPEQWGGARHVDGRCDLYALGITLYELCCGRRPFDDRAYREPAHVIIGRHLTTTAPDPRSFRAEVPENLAQIALKCLQKKPDDRYPDMPALRAALAAAYEQLTATAYPREIPRVGEARAAGLNNRAVSMWDLGKPDEAYTAWAEAIKLDPQHAESIYNMGLLDWRAAKTTDEAVEQRLVAAQTRTNRCSLYLGYIQLESCAGAESEAELLTALNDPSIAADGSIWRTLGHAQMAQKKFDQAEQSYQRALELNTDDVASACVKLARAKSRAPIEAATGAGGNDDDGGVFPNLACERAIQDRGGSVYSACFLPDGGSALSDGPLGAVMRWDLNSGRLIKSHSVHAKVVRCVGVTPDGLFSISGSEDGLVRKWNLGTDLAPDFFGRGHVGAIHALAVCPNGAFAVSGGGDKSLRVWELNKGHNVKTMWGHEREVHALAVTGDSNVLVSGGDDGSVRVWDIASATCRGVIKDGQKSVFGICTLPGNRQAVSAGTEGSLYLYDLETGVRERSFAGHHGTVRCVAVTRDGRFLFSGGEDHSIRLWDIVSGRCLRTLRAHTGPVQCLALSPDGLRLFAGSAEAEGRPLRVWKLEFAGGQPELYGAALAVCRVENQLQAQSTSKLFEEHLNAAQKAFETGATRDACLRLKQAREVSGYERDPRALALNAALSRSLSRSGLSAAYLRASTEYRHAMGVRAVAVTTDGTLAASAGREDKVVCLWDAATGKLLRTLEGHKQPAEAVALTPRGDLAISGGQDYRLIVWDTATGKSVRTMDGHNGAIHSIAMRNDGKNVLTACADGWMRYWDIAAGKCIKTLESDAAMQAGALSRDNRLAVSGHTDGTIRVWSLVSGKCLKTLSGHSGSIHDVAFTPDNRLLVSAGEDKTLRIWNVDAGMCTQVIKDPKARFQTIAVSPDSRYVFTGGHEGPETPLRLWDLATGKLLAVNGRHGKGISAYALSADGCLLVSGGEDTVRIWELEWELDPSRHLALQTLQAGGTIGPGAGPGPKLTGETRLPAASSAPTLPATPVSPKKKPDGPAPFRF